MNKTSHNDDPFKAVKVVLSNLHDMLKTVCYWTFWFYNLNLNRTHTSTHVNFLNQSESNKIISCGKNRIFHIKQVNKILIPYSRILFTYSQVKKNLCMITPKHNFRNNSKLNRFGWIMFETTDSLTSLHLARILHLLLLFHSSVCVCACRQHALVNKTRLCLLAIKLPTKLLVTESTWKFPIKNWKIDTNLSRILHHLYNCLRKKRNYRLISEVNTGECFN